MTILAALFVLAAAQAIHVTGVSSTVQVLAAVIGASIVIVGVLVAALKLRPDKNKIIAEASRAAVQAANEVLGALRHELELAGREVERLKERESALLDRIRHLEDLARDEARQLRRERDAALKQLQEAIRRYDELAAEHARCEKSGSDG